MVNETTYRLNDIFKGFMDITGVYSKFPFNRYPLSSPISVAATIIIYLAVIFGIQKFMRSRPPLQMTMLTFFHNMLLSIGSALLLVMIGIKLETPLLSRGLHYSVCSEEVYFPEIAFLYYINYLFKFYELLDTVILALRKKPLTFLHVYHHCLTLALCYIQILGESTVVCSILKTSLMDINTLQQWVPIVANLFVHAFMYWYYAMTSLKITVWWKKYLTALQITQFVVDVAFCCYAITIFELYNFKLTTITCYGTRFAGYFGISLLFSYLWLFVDFYKRSYLSRTNRMSQKTK